MDKKFQLDTKELDEKFAAIPENLKKRYDRHRFIRRTSMVFLALLFGHCINSFTTYLLYQYSYTRTNFVLRGNYFIHLLNDILFKARQGKKIQ